MQRLVLIDGHAILHRAYHALPPLKTKKGQLVNAVYGFISMIFKVITDLNPTYLAVCFDRPEPTFRHKKYPDYQATRPEMDKELKGQIELIKNVVKTMKIPIYEMPGYEADDVIGTLVKQAYKKAKLDETVIVTGDRDILQLVDEHTKVYMPVKGLSLAKLYDSKGVEEKFGIKPQKIVDYKALVGDPSDNYPGVSGIGPKTATKLLEEYKDLGGIYKALNKLNNKAIVQKLLKGKENAYLSKELAKIVCDVPLELDLTKSKVEKLDNNQIVDIFKELGFKTLLKRLKQLVVSNNRENQDKKKSVFKKAINEKKEELNNQLNLF